MFVRRIYHRKTGIIYLCGPVHRSRKRGWENVRRRGGKDRYRRGLNWNGNALTTHPYRFHDQGLTTQRIVDVYID